MVEGSSRRQTQDARQKFARSLFVVAPYDRVIELGHHSFPWAAANSHCRIADVRLDVGFASSRARSISATSALTGQPRSRACVSSARQNIGSRLIEVG